MSDLPPSYVVYIDEAGDPGIKTKADVSDKALEWFTLGAVVVSSDRDIDAVDWVRDMREAVRSQSNSPLHFRNLSPPNRQRVCRMLATKPVRLFAVATHKTNMRGYQNKRMGKPLGRGEFYNWCLRLLLERVSGWCAEHAKLKGQEAGPLRLIFSERGGHDFGHLFSYLELLKMQAENGGLFLKRRAIVPALLSRKCWSVIPHSKLAGLQLADIVASAFFQAANTQSTNHDLEPAKLLKPRVARERGKRDAVDFGVTAWPRPVQAPLPAEDRAIFEYFGYGFEKSDGPRF